MPTTKTITPAKARSILKQKRLTLRAAAPILGVDFRHLHRVVQGTRPSRRLLQKISALEKGGAQ